MNKEVCLILLTQRRLPFLSAGPGYKRRLMLVLLLGLTLHTTFLCATPPSLQPTPFLLLKAPLSAEYFEAPQRHGRGVDGIPHIKGNALTGPSPGTLWKEVGDSGMKQAQSPG